MEDDYDAWCRSVNRAFGVNVRHPDGFEIRSENVLHVETTEKDVPECFYSQMLCSLLDHKSVSCPPTPKEGGGLNREEKTRLSRRLILGLAQGDGGEPGSGETSLENQVWAVPDGKFLATNEQCVSELQDLLRDVRKKNLLYRDLESCKVQTRIVKEAMRAKSDE